MYVIIIIKKTAPSTVSLKIIIFCSTRDTDCYKRRRPEEVSNTFYPDLHNNILFFVDKRFTYCIAIDFN